MDTDEAAELLTLAQRETKPPKPKALRPLGRNAVITSGYAIAEATFPTGQHTPNATIPYLVECWVDALHPADQAASAVTTLYMNRTVTPVRCSSTAWHQFLDISIGGTEVRVGVPAGPHYDITIAVTACMFPMTSDGKAPDCRVFQTAMIEAVGKAAKQAGNEIASQMSAAQKRFSQQRRREDREDARALRIADREARQQRQANNARWKAEQKKLPTIKDVVLELLPGAIQTEAASGHLFNTRRLLYRIRDEVQRRTGKELVQDTFNGLVTEIEHEQGKDLHPLLIREARGNFRIPHLGTTVPLGTLEVRRFHRPSWYFNKIITIEKEDLRLMLEQAGWDERHDALLMSAKGFNTRAARDLIDKVVGTTEPVRAFSVHDADASGTLIQHTLQNATLARAARTIEITDLGLQPWEGIALGLPVEAVPPSFNKDGSPKYRPVGDYIRARTDRAPSGETWEEWLQHSRFELNAFTSAELIEWLDRKMAEHGAGKLIPPDNVLQEGFRSRISGRVNAAVDDQVEQRRNERVAAADRDQTQATANIRAEIARVTAPLLKQMAAVAAPLRERLAEIKAPFQQRKTEADQEARNADREAIARRSIDEITPNGDKLREGINAAFVERPSALWSHELNAIADGENIGEIDLQGMAT